MMQKGHVVVDDLYHRVIADKTVFSQCGVEDPDARCISSAGCIQQTPMCVGNGKQSDGATGLQFVGVGAFQNRQRRNR